MLWASFVHALLFAFFSPPPRWESSKTTSSSFFLAHARVFLYILLYIAYIAVTKGILFQDVMPHLCPSFSLSLSLSPLVRPLEKCSSIWAKGRHLLESLDSSCVSFLTDGRDAVERTQKEGKKRVSFAHFSMEQSSLQEAGEKKEIKVGNEGLFLSLPTLLVSRSLAFCLSVVRWKPSWWQKQASKHYERKKKKKRGDYFFSRLRSSSFFVLSLSPIWSCSLLAIIPQARLFRWVLVPASQQARAQSVLVQ